MRRVWFAPLEREVSVVGFGCASVGSRAGEMQSLRLLQCAHDEGINWIDVAPSYGDGNAERIVGKFQRGKRGELVICSKVGYAPRSRSDIRSLAAPVARFVAQQFPGARQLLRKARAQPTREPVTGAKVTESINQSLRRLGTDYVDLFMIHDAKSSEVRCDDIMRALEEAVRAGKTRAVGISGDSLTIAEGIRSAEVFAVGQVANNIFNQGAAEVRRLIQAHDRVFGVVGHTALGFNGPHQALCASMSANIALTASARDLGYCGSISEIAAQILVDFAFSSNIGGVTLLSMLSEDRIRSNADRASSSIDLVALTDFVEQFRAARRA